MKRMISKICGAMLLGFTSTMVLADDQVPTTAPAVAAVAAVPVVRSNPRVEVFPFSAISGLTTFRDWTGRGIQESLQSDISRTSAVLVMGPHDIAPTDDLMALAKQNHADLEVTGTYQIVDDQIRVDGHLIDVATGTPMGGFSATGSQHDLFKVEDALGEQLRALLPRPIPLVQSSQAVDQTPPTIVYVSPASSATPQPVNNYYYDTPPVSAYYPDYDYGYASPFGLGFYGGLELVSPGYYGHDRGFNNRGFNNRGLTPNPTFRNPVYRGSAGSVGGGLRGGNLGGGLRGGAIRR